jgi:hypothetical protein
MEFATARPGREPGARRPRPEPRAPVHSPTRVDAGAHTGLTLRRCACGGGCPRCRASAGDPPLAINTPGDAFEREADGAADAVMSGKSTHYFKKGKTDDANMSFAVYFFPGSAGGSKQAIHRGDLDEGSLACVHVQSLKKMRQINYHSMAGVTKVKIEYNQRIRKPVCCVRKKYKHDAGNPCSGVGCP